MNPSAFAQFQTRTRHGQWMTAQFTPSLASVIIPTFNRQDLIAATLDSVVNQTYRPIEILIVDDGSVDQTLEVVRQYQRQHTSDPSLEIHLFSPARGGACHARNFGLIQSKGEFIQFLDSDDLIDPRKLRIQIDMLQASPRCGVAFGDMRKFVDEPPVPGPIGDNAIALNPADLLATKRVLTTEGVYRRHVIQTAGPWPEDFPVGDDMEFNFRVLLACEEARYRRGEFYWYRQHAGSRLTDGFRMARGLHELQISHRLAELAVAFDVLDNPSLVQTLALLYTVAIFSSLDDARPAQARQGIAECLRLPINLPRRARMHSLWLLSHLRPAPYQRAKRLLIGISKRIPRPARSDSIKP